MASVDLIGWSIVETSAYILTNCLPHFRPLLAHYLPSSLRQAFKSKAGNSSPGAGTNPRSRIARFNSKTGNILGSKTPSSSTILEDDQDEDEIRLTDVKKTWSQDTERGMQGVTMTREMRSTPADI